MHTREEKLENGRRAINEMFDYVNDIDPDVIAGYNSEGFDFEFFDVFGREIGTTPSKDLYKFFDKEGNMPNMKEALMADAIGTITGSFTGTSTVTTFVESGSGVAAGGRSGLTALSTAVCFFLAIFLMPLIASIPSAAASSALLYVGCLMLKGIKLLKFENVKHLVPAFLTIAMMPLAYSITTGIGFGIMSYVLIEFIPTS